MGKNKSESSTKDEGLPRKLVIVGDGGSGKTSLMTTYAKGYFPNVYIPTIFENYLKNLVVDDVPIELALWDTAGQEDYDRLRPLSYPDSDVVLIAVALDNRNSLLNVPEKWAPEVKHYCPGVPVLLVGTKSDVRDACTEGSKADLVRKEDAMEVAEKIKAVAYMECSALTLKGVDAVFEAAVRFTLKDKRRTKRICSIL